MAAHFQDDTITIHKIQCGSFGNNAYLLVCPETNQSIVIDTPPDPGALIAAAKETDVQSIIITHNHWDHIEGLEEVTSAIGAPVGIGADDAEGLPNAPQIPDSRRGRDNRRNSDAQSHIHPGAHAGLYVLLLRPSPVHRRYPVSRRPR